MSNRNLGPQRENHNRPGNTAAISAAQLALSTEPVEGRQYVRLRKRQIEPDAHQPRRRKQFKAIRDKRESLDKEGQQTPVRVGPSTGKVNRQGELIYPLRDGELRWLGVPNGEDFLDAIIEGPMTAEEVYTSQVVSNMGEEFSVAERCSIAWTLNNRFGKTHKEIAAGALRKYANGDPERVGKWARVWDKLSPDVFGEIQDPLSKGIDDLLADYDDTFTHVEAIVCAPKSKWAHAIKMVKGDPANGIKGATVAQLKAYLYPEKPKAPARQTNPSPSGGSGTTIHRNSGGGGAEAPKPDVHEKGLALLKVAANEPAAPEPERNEDGYTEEELEAIGSDFWEGEERVVNGNVIQIHLTGLKVSSVALIRDLPTFVARNDTTDIARDAVTTQIEDSIRLLLGALRAIKAV